MYTFSIDGLDLSSMLHPASSVFNLASPQYFLKGLNDIFSHDETQTHSRPGLLLGGA